MKADDKTERAVSNALDKLWDAYQGRDADGLLASFAPDADVVLYGTGADEKRIGLAEIETQFRRDWSQSEAAFLKFQWHSVSSAGPVAWVAADGAAYIKVDGQEVTMPLRLTAVLERRGDKWLFAQMHVSTPAAEQAEGESWPT